MLTKILPFFIASSLYAGPCASTNKVADEKAQPPLKLQEIYCIYTKESLPRPDGKNAVRTTHYTSKVTWTLYHNPPKKAR